VTQAQVQSILSAHCTTCHAGAGAPRGLDLTNVGAVVGTASVECSAKERIASGSSTTSYLVDKIMGAAQVGSCFSGVRMPAGGAPALSTADINTIATWINEGTP
jgi:hypothetical protein